VTASAPPQGVTGADLGVAEGSRRTAGQEWRENWPLALTSALGMSMATIAVYSSGLFFEPLEREFGWSRAEVSSGMTIYSFIAVLLSPSIGKLIDRWGARCVAIPGVILFGAMFAALSLAGPSIASWWGLWLGVALASLGVMPTLWIVAVSNRFQVSRGLAIASCMCGTAISSFSVPLLARWLIDTVGWRMAYVHIGLGWLAVVLLLVIFFFHARDRSAPASRSQKVEPSPNLPGLTFQEAIRTRPFQKLCVASLFVSISVAGATVHFVPIVTMGGLSREAAAGVLSLLGIASAFGKLGMGWLFDRLDARGIAALCMALPAVPLAMLGVTSGAHMISVSVAIVCVLFMGFSAGAELTVTAFLTTRYVGLRAFAQNYGVISSIMALASGVGPLVAGLIYDHMGNYDVLLYGAIPTTLIAALCIWTLGPYPVWKEEER
jgi:predicted MFS family arabinose efflux permease